MSKKLIKTAQKELARARKASRAAETLLEHQLYEDAVSRAYYAVLHASKAARQPLICILILTGAYAECLDCIWSKQI